MKTKHIIPDGYVIAFDAIKPRCKKATIPLSVAIPDIVHTIGEMKRLKSTGRALNIRMAFFHSGKRVGSVATLEEIESV